ncbi:hypothetical protein ES705_12387 [subsurface metagenome]
MLPSILRDLLRKVFGGGSDISAANPLPVDTSPGNKSPITVLDEDTILGGITTPLGDCANIDLAHGPDTLALTIEALYGAATAGIRIHIRTSYTDMASGTHTGGMGVALLTDAAAHFGNVDELVGLTVHNVTDGSIGEITANTLTTITAVLAGGTDDLWDTNDEYFIVGAIFDTEDWDVWNPTFAAGEFVRETKHYDTDPFVMKVLVENLDGVNAVDDVLVVATIGA